MIIVVHHNQISQLQMSGKGGSLTSNTFLSTSIAKVTISMVVYPINVSSVEEDRVPMTSNPGLL